MAKTKILLVEDDSTLIEMYQLKFTEEGWDVVVLSKGNHVLETAQKEKPKIILLDIMLPGLDGFAVLQELKSNAKTKKIPVILLSNLGQDSDIQKGKELGAVDHMIKADFTPAQVVEKVKKYLK
jgi:two-component system alkaline phosphatase synthesis response regulator PhoP